MCMCLLAVHSVMLGGRDERSCIVECVLVYVDVCVCVRCYCGDGRITWFSYLQICTKHHRNNERFVESTNATLMHTYMYYSILILFDNVYNGRKMYIVYTVDYRPVVLCGETFARVLCVYWYCERLVRVVRKINHYSLARLDQINKRACV